jgi:hypothetical protein
MGNAQTPTNITPHSEKTESSQAREICVCTARYRALGDPAHPSHSHFCPSTINTQLASLLFPEFQLWITKCNYTQLFSAEQHTILIQADPGL